MTLLLKDLQAIVWEDYAGKDGIGPHALREQLDRQVSFQHLTDEEKERFVRIIRHGLGEHLDRIVELTVKRLGKHISDTGEVCDSPEWRPPEQRGPSYSKYDRGRRRR